MTGHARSIAMAFVVAAFALMTSAAVAQSYSGDWPATVTHSQRSNGPYCISLTDDGSYGAAHSGPAQLIPNNSFYPGYFTVVNGLITVSITYTSGPGDCCAYQVFTARASDGHIGNGVFNYFGITDIGLLTFGKKGGCSS
jgi:hypothetical protein